MMYFYVVSVYSRDGFYDFLTMSKEPLTGEEILTKSKEKRLFTENRDARDAVVDMNPCSDEIARFKRYYEI